MGSLLCVLLMLFTIHVHNQYVIGQHQLNHINQQLATTNNHNESLKGIANELTTDTRLQQIAQQNGLNLNNNSIKNIRKAR